MSLWASRKAYSYDQKEITVLPITPAINTHHSFYIPRTLLQGLCLTFAVIL